MLKRKKGGRDVTWTTLGPLDLVAVGWFLICSFGYAWATTRGPLSRRPNLVAAVEARRNAWMLEAAKREVRIVDAQLHMTLSSGTAFFASTTVIVLGGLAAMLGAADDLKTRLQELPLMGEVPIATLEIKILFVMAIVIRAFFKFAWAFRLTHYTSIMMGALPTWPADDDPAAIEACRRHAAKTARMSGLAALHNNDGLRSMYFAIAGLGWFLHPLVFIGGCAWVVAIVYRREFRSRALAAIEDDVPTGI